SSAIVTFAKSSNALTNQILLTANRKPYELFAIDPTQGLARALDFAASGDGPDDANLLYLLGQIDGLATSDEVSQALISLTPPSNNGLVQASFSGMNVSFERINERMYDLHLWMEQQARLQSGINNGDKFGVLGFWAQALGASLNQNGRDGLAGYDANSKGLALGVDWRYNDCSALGFAISYNKADVNDKNQNPKDENIRSWQGTTYAWIDLANGMYVNGILGLAFNDYDVDRTIRFNQINRVSHGNFDGWQFGLQTDAGWFLINNNEYFVTPFARLKYTLLNLDNYTETGAGPLSLSVESQSLDQLLGGVGVKFGKPFVSKHLVFIPEVTTFLSYDFVNDGEQTTASFVGNSLAFDTNGITPGKVAFDFGVGVSTHIDEQSIFTIKYDLTLRNHFNANSGYLEYYYLWG
ncbi:MAG: autotransporter outer membrane beta-barrel domain-containing protein, partial [Candidatus Berkiella sp.]